MKKYIIFLFLALSAATYGQTRPAYCEISAYNFWGFGKVHVIIDLGESRYGTIVDENGKAMKFNSPVDILNHMSKLGWKVSQTYFITSGSNSKQQVIRYLLEKQVTEDSQISEGIFVKMPEKYKPGSSGDDMY